jgi:hypothetical protein
MIEKTSVALIQKILLQKLKSEDTILPWICCSLFISFFLRFCTIGLTHKHLVAYVWWQPSTLLGFINQNCVHTIFFHYSVSFFHIVGYRWKLNVIIGCVRFVLFETSHDGSSSMANECICSVIFWFRILFHTLLIFN